MFIFVCMCCCFCLFVFERVLGVYTCVFVVSSFVRVDVCAWSCVYGHVCVRVGVCVCVYPADVSVALQTHPRLWRLLKVCVGCGSVSAPKW